MKLKNWSNEDIEFLKGNYSILGRKKCAYELQKTDNQIKVAVKILKLRVDYKKTPEEIKQELMKYNFTIINNKLTCFRQCSCCNGKIKFQAQKESYLLRNVKKSEKKSSLCNKCNMTGEKNHFFGRFHTKETKLIQSKNRIGKACGKDNAMFNPKFRKKVSISLKKKYDNGELDHVKKKNKENMIKNHKDGKIKNLPISLQEIEIKRNLQNKGFNIISQFKIDSLSYDLYFVEYNALLEFNGDYWHCNPEKYNKDYLNKKKNMYAWQLWERDNKKKELAIKNGFKFFTIWEKDYKLDKEKEIIKIINSL